MGQSSSKSMQTSSQQDDEKRMHNENQTIFKYDDSVLINIFSFLRKQDTIRLTQTASTSYQFFQRNKALVQQIPYAPLNYTFSHSYNLYSLHDYLRTICFLSNTMLAAGMNNGEIRIFDLRSTKDNEYISLRDSHKGEVSAITPLSNNKFATAGYDGKIKIWDLSRTHGEELLIELNGHSGKIRTLISLPDDKLASGGESSEIKIWDLKKPKGQECIKSLNGHHLHVGKLIALGSNKIASCGGNNKILIWDINKPIGNECIQSLIVSEAFQYGYISALTSLSDNILAAGDGNHGGIQIFDLTKPQGNECIFSLEGSKGIHTWSLSKLPDGRLISVGSNRQITIWSLSDFTPEVTFKALQGVLDNHLPDLPILFTMHPDGRFICGTQKGFIIHTFQRIDLHENDSQSLKL